MFYSKKISYLDYCENGERIAGGGFLKTEFHDSELKLYMSVRGLRQSGRIAPEVILYSRTGEMLLGQIRLENGQGEFRHECHIESGDATPVDPNKLLIAIKVSLGESRELRCIWQRDVEKNIPQNLLHGEQWKEAVTEPSQPKLQQQESPQPKLQQQESPQSNIEFQEDGLAKEQLQEVLHPKSQLPENLYTGLTSKGSTQTESFSVEPSTTKLPREESPATEGAGAMAVSKKEVQTVIHLMEDKWRQIAVIYPHVQPFQDDRDYLSITPADFVLFSADSYRAVNNSFLLHGYYNYKHLILTRLEQRGEEMYYLGVPGNYYDREKQVAVIFGFESFECAEEPAQEGDFGYYMMRVQL